MSEYRLTFGADPEFFVFKSDQDGAPTDTIVPAWNITSGTKKDPQDIPDLGPDFRILHDGPMVEFNVPAFESGHALRIAMQDVFAWYYEFHGELGQHEDLHTWIDPSRSRFWFDENSDIARDPRFTEVGCEPDIDAFTTEPNRTTYEMLRRRVHNKKSQVERTAGGHIHIGIDPWPQIPKIAFARIVSGLWGAEVMGTNDSAILQGSEHPYRKNGLFREKPYGIEFRSPPNTIFTGPYEKSLRRFLNRIEALVDILFTSPNLTQNLLAAYKAIPWQDYAHDNMRINGYNTICRVVDVHQTQIQMGREGDLAMRVHQAVFDEVIARRERA